MKLSINLFLFITATVVLSGCTERYPIYDDCKEPIYMSYKEFRELPRIEKPKEIKKAGKIYIYNDLLFINEPNKGIHIIDNTNKSKPIKKYFINLPGNIDISVKNGYLYADSFTDLVVLDIRDIDNIIKVHREENVFIYDPLQTQTDRNAFYCYGDKEKGVIIGYKD